MSEQEKLTLAKMVRELTENSPFILILCDRRPGDVFPQMHSIVYAHPVDAKNMLQYADETIKPMLE